MSNKLSEPFQTYWNGKEKRPNQKPVSSSSTIDAETEAQNDAWIVLRKAIQTAALNRWKTSNHQ